MITRWKINNFKSILSADLPISPITIFAGANSGGKSTLLQSILLISQTLSYKIGSRSVVLNGPLIKLGQFDDLKTYGSPDSNITIGFECKPPDISSPDVNASLNNKMIYFPPGYYNIDNISCEFSFNTKTKNVKDNLLKTQPKLNESSIKVVSDEIQGNHHVNSINIKRSRSLKSKYNKLSDCVEEDQVNLIDIRSLSHNIFKQAEYLGEDKNIIMDSLDFDVKVDKRFHNYLSDKWKNYEIMGCSTSHFLPDKIYLRVDTKLQDARFILKLFNRRDDDLRFDFVCRSGKEKMTIPTKLVRLFDDILNINVYNLLEFDDEDLREADAVMLLNYFDLYHSLPSRDRIIARNIIKKNQYNIISSTYDCLKNEAGGKDSYRIETSEPIDEIRDAVDYIDSYFSAKVKYLGPLRDDPKSLYPITNNSSSFDIGIKGEYTASVMDIFKNSKVDFISPKQFIDRNISKEKESVSLEIAVSEWLRYLDIAHNTSSKDLGKLGHELKVTLSPQGQGHDLTHVGVGVSQVLPILVMCLISKKDDLIILEQPELHLHPKVQTRLADFFLSIMLTGKQCIIETHSEYLINRIRYRAATERDGNKVTENLRIYFTNKVEDKTIFNNVIVNEYGAILDWPEGFFDQSQREAEEILREALRKKDEIRKGFKK